MIKKIYSHISSFDFFKGLILTILLVIPFYWGFQTGKLDTAFVFILGLMFGYFANIEGTNKHRIIGMIISLLWAIAVLSACLLSYSYFGKFQIAVITLLVFISSMLSAYGFRASMVSFSGLFAIVMSFAVHEMDIPFTEIILSILSSGSLYILVSGISQGLYQRRHIQLLLADSLELTAKYLELNDQINWNHSTGDYQNELLKIQSKINEKHELLRNLLMGRQSRLISSNKSRKYFLFFSELINIYEMAVAKPVDVDALKEELGIHFENLTVFRVIGSDILGELRKLARNIRFHGDFSINENFKSNFETAEKVIENYILEVKLPQAREGALLLRNLLDHEFKQWEKIVNLERILNNLQETGAVVAKKTKQFISTQDYSFKVLKSNLSFESAIFRHSLRITTAVLFSFLLGRWLGEANTNWIIITVIVILRPNYGLTKSRAWNRVLGTVLGALIALFLVFLTTNSAVIGWIASFSVLMGFSYIQKNYRLASLFLTLSILLLYVLKQQNPFELIENRIIFTFLGAGIAFLSMYLLWPVWEFGSINDAIQEAILANRKYLDSVSKIYHTKDMTEIGYKLNRKEAFLKNGNLNATFQRMTEEPKSKQKKISNIYAIVLLNHSFLSAVAAFSAYIQGHTTTEASPQFDIIIKRIQWNLDQSLAVLKKQDTDPNKIKTDEAFKILEKKYKELNELRNLELLSGKMVLSTNMREKLQEGKVIIDQLKWLKNLSGNIRNTAEAL
jgi:uncharacterized membrane protein YccC